MCCPATNPIGIPRRADPYKYLTWSWTLGEEQPQGMTRPQFARYYMMRLGIGNDLKRVALNPEFPHKLASVEEVLALRPELRPLG